MSQGTLPLQTYFGPFFLQKLIAVGGMAEIYLCRTVGLAGFEKQLALKVIHPDYADDKTFIQMLVNEAKIAVGLNHHNIAQTFDLGHIGNRYFISMEYVEGMDLFQLLRALSERGTTMPMEMAVYVVHEALGGLEYAHTKCDEQGKPLKTIHRDMSPQNLLCSRLGEVKIIDFGIAKAANLTNKTRAGVIKGKLVYMSPEQAWGDPVDHRTDIFSTGIVLYEALIGSSLHVEKNPVKLLEMVRKVELAPPSHRRPEIPPELDELVMRALAPRPADRYQSAREFAAALSDYLRRHAPALTEQDLGQLVDRSLAAAPAADVEVDKMARDDFAVREHSIIFSANDMISSNPPPLGRPPVPPAAPPPPAPIKGKPSARLLLFENGEAKPFNVDEQFIIGRSGDLRLGDARVSRRHARISLADDGYHLEDLDSANGTFLNEEKVMARALLRSGDIIRVGPFEMRFVLAEVAVAPALEVPAAAPRFEHEPTPVKVDEEPSPARHPAPPPIPSPPQVSPPQVSPPQVSPPQISPPQVSPPQVSPPRVSPPRVSPPRVSAVDLTDRRAPSADEGLWLTVRFGDERLRLPAGGGMALAHSLVLGQTSLAGENVQLVRRADGYWLEPARGGRAVLLNGSAVTEPVPVRPGDALQLGPLNVAFETYR